MVYEFTSEQVELRSVVRSLLAAESSETSLRQAIATSQGYDRALWLRMADELGLCGLIIPEEHGGSGAGMVELAIVLEELGRALYAGPFLPTALVALAILTSADEAAVADLLPGIADGERIATFALSEESGRWDADGVQCRAEEINGNWQLSGQKRYVLDGQVATLLVVAARTPDGVALFAVASDATGVASRAEEAFDVTRRLATIELDATPARLLGDVTAGEQHLQQLLDRISVCVAAEQVGGAQAALDMAVGYAKERVQFGRAIGSFQAIKHLCADLLLDVESAKSAAYYGAWAIDDNSPELATVAPLVKAYCSDTFLATASSNIQIHGGIAFTWEHPAHLYYRRAKSGAQLWGDPRTHRDALAGRLVA
ncbi:MAG: putative acyl-CoA dehydrogenase [Mycobacterium sp.]|nr:putative acyl-CoA dehydrogenase [Mycobacterium sp.]